MTRPVQIAVVGSGPDGETESIAEDVGARIARAGARLVCGGGGGVMEAASRGAAEAGGEVIGIVPTASPDDANEHVTHPVATGVGHARNLAVVATSDAVIAVGGSWGTLSEIALARRLGRPVVALASWTLESPVAEDEGTGIEVAEVAEEAVRIALDAASGAAGGV